MSVLIAPFLDVEEVEIVFDSLEVQVISEIITILDVEEGDFDVQFLEEILFVDHDGKLVIQIGLMKQGVIRFSILGLDVCPRCGETHDLRSYCGDMSDYDDFYDPMLTEVTDVGDDFIDFNDSADDSNTSSSDDDTSDDDSNTSY